MNESRRKELKHVLALISEAHSIVEQCRDDEQESYDNMPESLQMGEKGEKATNAIDSLENAISAMEDTEQAIEEAAQ